MVSTQVIKKLWAAYADHGGNATWTTRHTAITAFTGPSSLQQFWGEVNFSQSVKADAMYVLYLRDSNVGDIDWSDSANWTKYRDRIWAYGLGVCEGSIPFRELIEPKTSRNMSENENLYMFTAVRGVSAASTASRQSFAYTLIYST